MSNHPGKLVLLAAVSLGVVACDRPSSVAPTEATAGRDAAAPSTVPALAHAAKGSLPSGVVIPPPGGFASTGLARGALVDGIDVLFRLKEDRETLVRQVSAPSDVVMSKITIQQGGALPWHSPPGPVIVTIASGSLTLVDGDTCQPTTYVAGQTFADAGQGHVHVAFNSGVGEMVLYATYFGVPAGQSPLVPTTNPGC
jgi:quercetin dioxygenase-like cupin family protein